MQVHKNDRKIHISSTQQEIHCFEQSIIYSVHGQCTKCTFHNRRQN